MVKHTQTIRQLLPTNYLSVFDHFVGLALKGLTENGDQSIMKNLTEYSQKKLRRWTLKISNLECINKSTL